MIILLGVLLVLFIVLQGLDAWTTFRALQRPGCIEANPLVKRVMDAIGVIPALVVMKIFAIMAVGGGSAFVAIKFEDAGGLMCCALLLLCVLYAYVVMQNYERG